MSENEDKSFERLRFEHELINRRITWLLSSQTILFAAYALGIPDNPDQTDVPVIFLKVVPVIGSVVAFFILIGVVAGIIAKYKVWKDSWEKYWGVRTWITCIALVPDTLLPILFAVAWIILLSN